MPSFTQKTEISHFSAPTKDFKEGKVFSQKGFSFGLSKLNTAAGINFIIDLEDNGVDEVGELGYKINTRSLFFSKDFANAPNIEVLKNLVYDAFLQHTRYFNALKVTFPEIKSAVLPKISEEQFIEKLKDAYQNASPIV